LKVSTNVKIAMQCFEIFGGAFSPLVLGHPVLSTRTTSFRKIDLIES